MSAPGLRSIARDRLHLAISGYIEAVVTQTDLPLDQIRLYQGLVRGLREAAVIIDEAYKQTGD